MVEKATSRVKLDFLNAFGASFKNGSQYLTSSLHFLEDQKIIYPVGHHIAIRNLDDGPMTFIQLSDQVRQITAMKLSKNRKFLIVCMQHKVYPDAFIQVYDLKNSDQPRPLKEPINVTMLANEKGPVLMSANMAGANSGMPGISAVGTTFVSNANGLAAKSESVNLTSSNAGEENNFGFLTPGHFIIIDVNFSQQGTNSKYVCLTLTDGVDSKIIVIDFMSSIPKCEAAADFQKQQIRKCSFNPKDDTQLCTTGINHWKVWIMKDGGLKPGLPFTQKLNLNRHWTQHCWLDEKKLIGCTIDGEMYYIENDLQNKMFDIKKEFENAFNTDETQSHVVAIQRFSKGFFIGSQNGEMAMWVRSEENNSSSGKDPYDFVRKWQPPATKRQRVLGLSVSGNDDYLAVSLQNNNIGLVTIKSIGLNEDTSKEIKFELVCKGFHSEKISGVDVAVQRPILVTCSRDDSTVRLWNYKTGQCELAREYYVMEDNALRAQSKPLVAAAIHPSGYQLAISFIDKIWIHHILHDELRKLKSLEIKNATLLRYSRGGQYFFALEKQWIYVFNAYTLQLIKKFKHGGVRALEIVFSDLDRAFAIVSSDGYVGKWRIPSFQQIVADHQKDWTGTRHIDFIKEDRGVNIKEEDQFSLVIVGGGQGKQRMKLVNRMNKLCKSSQFRFEDGELTQTLHIKSNRGSMHKSIAAGTSNGEIWTMLHPFKENGQNKTLVHKGAVTRLVQTIDSSTLFSAGEDGTLFIYQINEEKITDQGQADGLGLQDAGGHVEVSDGDQGPTNLRIMDNELANIVLVKQHEMEKWINRQEKLKSDLDSTNRKVESKLAECRARYDNQYQAIKKQKELDIEDLRTRFRDLAYQKDLQERQNEEANMKMEKYHYEEVKEIEELFKKKLKHEGDAYLQLEQEGLEMKQHYEKQIDEIKKNNKISIEKLVEEFKTNLRKVQAEYNDSRQSGQNLKSYYEDKLLKQENEHELEIIELEESHKDEKKQKHSEWKKLQSEQVEHNSEKLSQKNRRLEAKERSEKAEEDRKQKMSQLEDGSERIELLKKENDEVIEKLKKRETDLYKYKFKIKDLRKSKHVLTHRAQEMRESLKPKESQIDGLKDQLLKLEEVLETEMAKMTTLSEELSKQASKMKQFENDLKRQEEMTKEKRAIVLKFAQDVHKIVQTKDDKQYVTGIMKLNQDYVMSQVAYQENGKKRDPEALEELNKQLKYMEDLITQLRVNTTKNETRTKNDVKLKTKENRQLIFDLNNLKYEYQKQRDAKRKKKNELQALEDQVRQREKTEKHLKSELNNLHQMHNTGAFSANQQDQDGASDSGQDRPKSKARMNSANRTANTADQQKEDEADESRVRELTHVVALNNQHMMENMQKIAHIKKQIKRTIQAKQIALGQQPTGE